MSREEERTVERIERLINCKIKRISRPDFAFSSRESLLKTVRKHSKNSRTNKVSQTVIRMDKTTGAKVKPKAKPKAKRPSK